MTKKFDLLDSQGALAFVLLVPSVLVIFGVLLFPMLSSLALSFTDLKMTKPGSGQFIGFDNFVAALGNPLFWASLGRTGIFTAATVVFEMTLGLAVALLLNAKFKGRAFVRGLIILPWALPYVVNGVMWKWIFDANYGVLNAILSQLGIIDAYKIWLGDPGTAMVIVIAANIWKETPVAVLLLLAALQAMPKDMFEAASIDGANRWTIFRRITLPFLKPMIVTLVVIKVIWALKEFDLIYIITKGGPASGTTLFSYYIYQNTFQYLNFGYGAALAYILTILALVMSFGYMKAMKGDQL
jgi:ABC-type sugar transport system permease subunit